MPQTIYFNQQSEREMKLLIIDIYIIFSCSHACMYKMHHSAVLIDAHWCCSKAIGSVISVHIVRGTYIKRFMSKTTCTFFLYINTYVSHPSYVQTLVYFHFVWRSKGDGWSQMHFLTLYLWPNLTSYGQNSFILLICPDKTCSSIMEH